MNRLKPGYIPDGWTLGEHVHVVEAEPGKTGAVLHAPRGLRNAFFEAGELGAVAMVRWRYEDTEEVAHWLAWWRSYRGLVVVKRHH